MKPDADYAQLEARAIAAIVKLKVDTAGMTEEGALEAVLHDLFSDSCRCPCGSPECVIRRIIES